MIFNLYPQELLKRDLKNDSEFVRALKVYTFPDTIVSANTLSEILGYPTECLNDEFVKSVWELCDRNKPENQPVGWLEENARTHKIELFVPVKTNTQEIADIVFYIGVKAMS